MISRAFFLSMITWSIALAGDDDPSLAVSLIPDSLKENSYAVVRNEEVIYEVHHLTKAVLTYRLTVTLLNNKLRSSAGIDVFYDPALTIRKLNGRKYDKGGNLIDVIKSKDISDHSYYTGSFYDDNRVKSFDLSYAEYPYTFQYEFEQEHNSVYLFPDWQPLTQFNTSVEKSSFTIIIPEAFTFRYKEINMPRSCIITESDGKKIYKWETNNLKAIEHEHRMADIRRYIPVVITAPDQFVHEKYPGEMSTWHSLGAWFNMLNEGRDQLSPEKEALVRSMVDTIPSRTDRIKILYEYM